MENEKNIFSWRSELKAKTPEERAKWFYNQKLIPQLAVDVAKAEQARQTTKHQEVKGIYELWTTEHSGKRYSCGVWYDVTRVGSVLDHISRRNKRFSGALSVEEDLIRAGYAGLGRIEHVDANSELKAVPPEDRNLRLSILMRIRRAQLFKDVYLGEKNLVPWTIHGGSIYWPGEFAQDDADTEIILGNTKQARELLDQSIDDTTRVFGGLSLRVNLDIPDSEAKKDYQSYKQRKKYIGACSALGVLYARRGRLEKHLDDLIEGLQYVGVANYFDKNPKRVATVALWAFSGSLSWKYFGSFRERMSAFMLGLTAGL